MVINTGLLRAKLDLGIGYVKVYGTQDEAWSSNYDILSKEECEKCAPYYLKASEQLKEFAQRIQQLSDRLPQKENENANT